MGITKKSRNNYRVMSTSTPDTVDTLYCSFCGTSQYYVTKLIAGDNCCICNLCFELGVEGLRRKNSIYTKRSEIVTCDFCLKSVNHGISLVAGQSNAICNE